MHLPSSVKEWQMPPYSAFPTPPDLFFLLDPEEEQDTSYLALSVKIFNLSESIIMRTFVCFSVLYHPYKIKSNICSCLFKSYINLFRCKIQVVVRR